MYDGLHDAADNCLLHFIVALISSSSSCIMYTESGVENLYNFFLIIPCSLCSTSNCSHVFEETGIRLSEASGEMPFCQFKREVINFLEVVTSQDTWKILMK
jgi:hypothetical protein